MKKMLICMMLSSFLWLSPKISSAREDRPIQLIHTNSLDRDGDVTGHFQVWKIIGVSGKRILYIGSDGIIYARYFDVQKIFKIILKTRETIDGQDIERVIFFVGQKQRFVDYFYIRCGGVIEANEIEWIVYN